MKPALAMSPKVKFLSMYINFLFRGGLPYGWGK